MPVYSVYYLYQKNTEEKGPSFGVCGEIGLVMMFKPRSENLLKRPSESKISYRDGSVIYSLFLMDEFQNS